MSIALFTGGASWFSREAARLLLADKWKVVLSDVNMPHLEEVAAQLGSPPGLKTCRLDVCDLQAVKSTIDAIAREHGGIDALVNVAGGTNHLGVARLPFHETDPQFWEKVIRTGLYGVMHCTHSVVPHMIAARRGGIVSVASGMALRGQPRMAVYSAVKHALVGFSQAIALEVAQYGVRVNTIAPGSAESRWQPDLTAAHGGRSSPLGRRTSAVDVANAIHFLLSEKADHITGSCMDLSGGTLLH
jgi:NAD(P)-dependent dehydrogenase (short-subunit alcohol dehydrogenase family)